MNTPPQSGSQTPVDDRVLHVLAETARGMLALHLGFERLEQDLNERVRVMQEQVQAHGQRQDEVISEVRSLVDDWLPSALSNLRQALEQAVGGAVDTLDSHVTQHSATLERGARASERLVEHMQQAREASATHTKHIQDAAEHLVMEGRRLSGELQSHAQLLDERADQLSSPIQKHTHQVDAALAALQLLEQRLNAAMARLESIKQTTQTGVENVTKLQVVTLRRLLGATVAINIFLLCLVLGVQLGMSINQVGVGLLAGGFSGVVLGGAVAFGLLALLGRRSSVAEVAVA